MKIITVRKDLTAYEVETIRLVILSLVCVGLAIAIGLVNNDRLEDQLANDRATHYGTRP